MSESIKKASSLAAAFSIASIWISVYVGPGFASGAMLVANLVGPSWLGVFIGPLFTAGYAGILSFFILEFARRHQLNDFRQVYDGVFGKYRHLFATMKDISVVLSIFVITTISFATAGHMIADLTGIHYMVGGIIILLIVGFLVLKGQKLVIRTATLFTVLLLIVVLGVIVIGVGPSWQGMTEYVSSRAVNTDFNAFPVWLPIDFSWLPTGAHLFIQFILFTNILTAFIDAAVPAANGTLKSQKEVALASGMGFVMTFTMTFFMNVILASGMPEIAAENIPTLWALQNIIGANTAVTTIYTITAVVAIMTTLSSFLFGVGERYQRSLHKVWKNSTYDMRRLVLLLIIAPIVIFFGGQSVPVLVLQGFNLIGYINKPFLEMPMFIIIPVLLYVKKRKALGAPEEESEEVLEPA